MSDDQADTDSSSPVKRFVLQNPAVDKRGPLNVVTVRDQTVPVEVTEGGPQSEPDAVEVTAPISQDVFTSVNHVSWPPEGVGIGPRRCGGDLDDPELEIEAVDGSEALRKYRESGFHVMTPDGAAVRVDNCDNASVAADDVTVVTSGGFTVVHSPTTLRLKDPQSGQETKPTFEVVADHPGRVEGTLPDGTFRLVDPKLHANLDEFKLGFDPDTSPRFFEDQIDLDNGDNFGRGLSM